jgi:hypothetical protein
MQTLLKRLRAVAVLAILWAIGWSVVGAGLGAYQYYFLAWPMGFISLPGFASPLVAVVLGSAFNGAEGGAISGALFALVLTVAERNRTAARLTLGRSAVWGVLGAVLVPSIMLTITMVRFPAILSDMPLLPFAIYLLCLALLGAACGLLTIALARRGTHVELRDTAA